MSTPATSDEDSNEEGLTATRAGTLSGPSQGGNVSSASNIQAPTCPAVDFSPNPPELLPGSFRCPRAHPSGPPSLILRPPLCSSSIASRHRGNLRSCQALYLLAMAARPSLNSGSVNTLEGEEAAPKSSSSVVVLLLVVLVLLLLFFSFSTHRQTSVLTRFT